MKAIFAAMENGKKVLIMVKEYIEREAAIDNFCVGDKI